LLLNVQRVKRSNIPDTQYNVVTSFTALPGCASLSLKVYSMVKSSVSLLVNELSAILVVL
jgi:ABC-type spermidine/putrescine transport system permease subunit II